MSQPVKIFIDGVCRKDRGPGGWGVILTKGSAQKELSGSDVETTQNRAEMTALITALSTLSRPCVVEIVTSSQYLVSGSCQWLENWKRNDWKTKNNAPVKNADLWAAIDDMFQRHSVAFTTVPENEKANLERRASKLANRALDDLSVAMKLSREELLNKACTAADGTRIDQIKIYTDGSCLKRRGNVGGWGAVFVVDGKEIQISGSELDTTANRMEMQAVIQALETAPHQAPVRISTDSKYVKKGMEEWIGKWKESGWITAEGEPVKNQDLWEKLDALCGERHVSWKWVKAHNGHQWNEKADTLARAASNNAANNLGIGAGEPEAPALSR